MSNETSAIRTRRFEIKSIVEEDRTFTGLASTWDLDLYGDVITPGAFKDTLKAWKSSGEVMPLLDSHNAWNSVRAIVGKMLEAKETEEGLEATFRVIDGPDGDEVFRRVKGGYVTGLSIGFEPKEVETPDEDQKRKGIWRILKKILLREVSVVAWPANPQARIKDIKSMIDLALDDLRPGCLTDDDRKDLRCVTGRIGSFLRPPAPEGEAPAAEEKTAEPDGTQDPPEAPPGKPADVPKADDAEPLYRYDEALSARIRGVRTRQVRLNIQGQPTEGE